MARRNEQERLFELTRYERELWKNFFHGSI